MEHLTLILLGYITPLYTFGRFLIEQLEVEDWVYVRLTSCIWHCFKSSHTCFAFCTLLAVLIICKAVPHSLHIHSMEHFRLIFICLSIYIKEMLKWILNGCCCHLLWLVKCHFSLSAYLLTLVSEFEFFVLMLRNGVICFCFLCTLTLCYYLSTWSRCCRMDDAEACFILSSRNEVDRMAAVRITTQQLFISYELSFICLQKLKSLMLSVIKTITN